MKKLLIILTLFAKPAFAQVDSLRNPVDSIQSALDLKIDSIQTSFNKQTDSLMQSYAEAKVKLETLKGKYESKLDSLNNLRLPTEKLTGKIDSLNNIKLPTEKCTAKIDSLNNELGQLQQKATAKIESLKSDVNEKIKSLNLPPEAQAKVSKLTASVEKLSLPSIDAEIAHKINLDKMNGIIPDLPGGLNPGIPAMNTPNVNANVPAVATPGVEVPGLDKLNSVTGQAGDIQAQVKEMANVEGAEKAIESKVSELDQVKAIQEQTALPVQQPATGEEAKEQLMELAKKEAVNHFAGKEAALQQAMDKMSKYKQKYNSVSSLKDLPDKRPNPMKEKPFVERLVPEIALQILIRDNFMMDMAPYVGYRFTERLTIGAGWNQRAVFNTEKSHTQTNVYGPRLYGQFKAFKGLSGRLELETMNAYVTQGVNADNGHREWVPAILAGMKQEYTIYKNLKGTAFVLYNFYNPDYKSPYGDRLSARIGFEYVIKKKPAQSSGKK